MRRLTACLVLLAASSAARADDVVVATTDAIETADDAPTPIELGLFGGGFISNYYHQFYDYELFPGQPGDLNLPVREELKRVSPLLGLRAAYFVKSWLGIEAELKLILTETKYTGKSANIYGGRLQLMFQYPSSGRVIPYVAIGDGFDRISSPDDTLGSDTDWAPHVGAGARFFISDSFAIRVDGRFLRAPSQQAPYHLNASLGEFMIGLSYRPGKAASDDGPALPPAIDSDGDGVIDVSDRCPAEPEDKDLFEDGDGCPDPDNDADGVLDGSDQCPLEAEDKDANSDDDGCIDADNDADGIPDAQDKCPNEPEDRDTFEDADGCPELDNDRDGFSDAQDRCPSEAEIINGNEDDDGCPDRGNALVVVTPDRLELLEAITFKKTTLHKDSLGLLAQIGATLRAHPEIARLRITVYVNPTKKPAADKKLSEQRAEAIRAWLIEYGIDEKRLDPRGFGGQNPLVPPKTRNAAAINDRVDLVILERE